MSASVDQLIINYQSDLTYHLTASQKMNILNILLPELFLSISIFSLLMIGVFLKNSFNLIFKLSLLTLILVV